MYPMIVFLITLLAAREACMTSDTNDLLGAKITRLRNVLMNLPSKKVMVNNSSWLNNPDNSMLGKSKTKRHVLNCDTIPEWLQEVFIPLKCKIHPKTSSVPPKTAQPDVTFTIHPNTPFKLSTTAKPKVVTKSTPNPGVIITRYPNTKNTYKPIATAEPKDVTSFTSKPVVPSTNQNCSNVPIWLQNIYPPLRCHIHNSSLKIHNSPSGEMGGGELLTAFRTLGSQGSAESMCDLYGTVYSEVIGKAGFLLLNFQAVFIAQTSSGIISLDNGSTELKTDSSSKNCTSDVVNDGLLELRFELRVATLLIRFQFSIFVEIENKVNETMIGTVGITMSDQKIKSVLEMTKELDGPCKFNVREFNLNTNITNQNYKAEILFAEDIKQLKKEHDWAIILNTFIVKYVFLSENFKVMGKLGEYHSTLVSTIGDTYNNDTGSDMCEDMLMTNNIK